MSESEAPSVARRRAHAAGPACQCGGVDSKVVKTLRKPGVIERRRRCRNCQRLFWTDEAIRGDLSRIDAAKTSLAIREFIARVEAEAEEQRFRRRSAIENSETNPLDQMEC